MNKRIPTNLRTLMILEALGTAGRPLTPTEIGDAIDLPKQTIHRLCTTLVNEGFLTRDVGGKRLRPARRSRELASDLLHGSRFQIGRHQILVKVAETVQETVNFVVPEAQGMTYLDRVESRWPFQVQLPIGTHVPFHCTASGKTFLASLAPSDRRAMVEGLRLESHTENTHRTPESLLQELSDVAREGYAIDNQEFIEGMVAIAVPVKDQHGRYIASIAFHGPIQRISVETAIANQSVLQEASKALSEVLLGRANQD